jgi:hypothetical protein
VNVSSCYRTVPDYGKYPDKTKIPSNFLKYKKDFVSIHDFERMSKAGGISGNTNTIPLVARKWNDIHQAERFLEPAHPLWS